MKWTITIPLKLESVANKRWHHMRLYRYHKAAKNAAMVIPRVSLPCEVLITRIAPRELDSHDNLRSSAKGLVDGIAARLGVKDNDSGLTWAYAQRKGNPGEYAVEVVVTEAA